MIGRGARGVAGAGVAVVLTLVTAGLSRLPVVLSDPGDALVRLSWRMDGVTVEACRERTEEELARLPVHMRTPRTCIGEVAPYEFRVVVDGRLVTADTLRPAGARGDRPLFVHVGVPVAAGRHGARVTFRALVPEGFVRPPEAPDLDWSGTLELASREVALITLVPGATRLELRLPGG